MIKYKSFIDDAEKMADFYKLSKEDFLNFYSYINAIEYDLTIIKIKNIKSKHAQIRHILISNDCPEYGDVIIDNICTVLNYPTTNIYYIEEVEK